ncbi:MAG: FecR domain-containing protein [Treponema sp.]|nr:FecR domain-containing protein [Treponema sp.]
MKKFILSIIFTAIAFSSFAMQATVISAKGKAEMQSGDSWVALKTGDSLNQGTVIQTGFKSEVVLKIKESTVTVAPLTRITLQTLAEREGLSGAKGKDETAIFLDTGSLKSNVQKSADRRVGFTVRSPVATASVRGTGFGFKTRYRSVKLSTTNGKVAFWRNTAKSEAALNNASSGPVGEGGDGNSAQDISDYAAANAIVVSQGESASAKQTGGMVSPAQSARSNSSDIGNGTRSASDAEKPNTFGVAQASSKGGSKNTAKTGSLVVSVVTDDD